MASYKEVRRGRIIFFAGLESRSSFVLKRYLQGCLEAKAMYI